VLGPGGNIERRLSKLAKFHPGHGEGRKA
jgi:hypothetical protein